MHFDLKTNQRIVFGRGVSKQARAVAAELGGRVMVVCGGEAGRYEWLMRAVEPCAVAHVKGEPRVEQARSAAALAREKGCGVVVACGGGSALDLGKAVAALAANSGDVLDYIEVVGRGEALPAAALPVVAIPTTSGTGSEATRNAVLHSTKHGVKASLRHDSMTPRVALVDPELTLSVPREVTAATGLDALTQLIEPFVSARANAETDPLCAEGIQLVAEALPRVLADGGDVEAREMMSLASLFSGMALTKAGLGAVHGLAAPLGGLFDAPHGAVCAALLEHVMKANREALPKGHAAARRYDLIAAWVDVADLVRMAGVPGLRAYGVRRERFAEIAEKASKASSMKANPVVLSEQTLIEVLQAAY